MPRRAGGEGSVHQVSERRGKVDPNGKGSVEPGIERDQDPVVSGIVDHGAPGRGGSPVRLLEGAPNTLAEIGSL